MGARPPAIQSEDQSPTSTPSPTESEKQFQQVDENPVSTKIFNQSAKPVVTSTAITPQDNVVETVERWNYEQWLVTNERERNALKFAKEGNGVASAKKFVKNIDFSEERLLVHQYSVPKCVSLNLTHLKFKEETINSEFSHLTIRLGYDFSNKESEECENKDDQSIFPKPNSGDVNTEATLIQINRTVDELGGFGYQVLPS